MLIQHNQRARARRLLLAYFQRKASLRDDNLRTTGSSST
jgi:hypothetical protein